MLLLEICSTLVLNWKLQTTLLDIYNFQSFWTFNLSLACFGFGYSPLTLEICSLLAYSFPLGHGRVHSGNHYAN
jgi:hypothetical protein